MRKKKINTTVVLLGISFVYISLAVGLTYLSRTEHEFGEYYAIHIYPYISSVFAHISNLVSFSLAEYFLLALSVFYIFSFFRGIIQIIRKKKKIKSVLASWGSKTIFGVSLFLLIYVLNCGINYQRQTFSKVSGITIEQHSKEELEELCRWLAEQINDTSRQIERDENGSVKLNLNKEEQAVAAMENIGKQYSYLQGYYPRTKPITISKFWSYQYITGIYSPFTVEANYNKDIPAQEIPFTMCHELSHLRGFMREDEANFIAYLACRESGDSAFMYSGYMCAFTYAMSKLYSACGAECYFDIYNSLDEDVIAERQVRSVWWKQYETPVEKVANKVNDTYLKVNAQTDGIQSYGRMVDLLLQDFVNR